MKTLLTLIVLVAAVALGGYYYWHNRGATVPRFRTLPAARGDLQTGVTATGMVEPVDTIDVGAQIVGSIKSFGPDPSQPGKMIDFNSRVKENDLLARIDDQPYQAELEKAIANLRLAEAELKRARAQEKQMERDFPRAERLRGTNAAAEFETAESAYETAQADRAMCEAKVEQAKIARKQAEINLGYTVIRSPVNGTVIDRKVNVGQTLVTGLNAPCLFLLAKDLGRMLVRAAVNEADIGDIHEGQKATFKVDAYRDRTFGGAVSQIRLNASLSNNVVTYEVVVDVDNRDGMLRPYMTAKLHFEVARRKDVLLVPNQALRWRPTWEQVSATARAGLTRPERVERADDEKAKAAADNEEPRVETSEPTVWLMAGDGLVRPVQVKLGLSDGISTEITGGDLAPGAALVVNAVREAQPDFVSSFISRVTKK